MIRIGFVGVPSSGKTTLARALAGAIGIKTKFKTIELVPEYARTYRQKYGIDGIQDQVRILNKQIELEERYPPTLEVLITDSPIFLGFGYAIELKRPGSIKDNMILNDVFKIMSKANVTPRYDIIFHLPPVLEPIKDGLRPEEHFDPEWRAEADVRLKSVFYVFPPKKLISLETVTLDDRVNECLLHINKLK